ncbi:hypothetical protein SUGI_0101510 [Cryptomeria japonica]|nr:hypothetical protein SUGI_0101510 [Cryptomeria japonica]
MNVYTLKETLAFVTLLILSTVHCSGAHIAIIMPSRRPEHPTRVEILCQAVIDDEPLDEADPGPTQGTMVPVGRPGPPRAPWSLQGAMVPDRAPWSLIGRHGP